MNYMFDTVAARECNRLSEYLSWFGAVGATEHSIWEKLNTSVNGVLAEYMFNGKGPYTLHTRFFKPIQVQVIPLEDWL